ncbi:MAG: hypothetical protein ACR2RB_12025 [Gammaproteobacteria bacterium]
MEFSIKSMQIFAADKAAVWDWIAGKYFAKIHFPEMSRDTSAWPEYVKVTHKAGSQIRPSWAIDGKAIAWDANARIKITLPRDDVDVESILISLEQHAEQTAVTLTVEGNTDFGPGYWGACNSVKAVINDKLDAMREDIETPQTHEIPVAA